MSYNKRDFVPFPEKPGKPKTLFCAYSANFGVSGSYSNITNWVATIDTRNGIRNAGEYYEIPEDGLYNISGKAGKDSAVGSEVVGMYIYSYNPTTGVTTDISIAEDEVASSAMIITPCNTPRIVSLLAGDRILVQAKGSAGGSLRADTYSTILTVEKISDPLALPLPNFY